ncbi:hypothetical protein B0T11DRAFT_335615 [Plectosphaerella cucumerina]|uniref:Voltage-gated hydrogen channel 1 n=1 Tax=Plectosphaerella cucumerina TaxID=40658 RepID=A0A8K0TQ65_9PEZI|nr:hypothetical protein B0T11DRAFT_335615 [Plectosphaerella cucumerina]
MPVDSDSEPLLRHGGTDDEDKNAQWFSALNREKLGNLLSSRKTHYLILALVALDVSALLGNIFLELIACDTNREPEAWNASLREALTAAGLVFSSVFLLELAACILAFGAGYFADWFHCVDGAVIIASFVIDLLSHGIVEDIASLVIIFRLFRLVKLVEEMSLGASVRMESMGEELDRLQEENSELKARLRRRGEDVV